LAEVLPIALHAAESRFTEDSSPQLVYKSSPLERQCEGSIFVLRKKARSTHPTHTGTMMSLSDDSDLVMRLRSVIGIAYKQHPLIGGSNRARSA